MLRRPDRCCFKRNVLLRCRYSRMQTCLYQSAQSLSAALLPYAGQTGSELPHLPTFGEDSRITGFRASPILGRRVKVDALPPRGARPARPATRRTGSVPVDGVLFDQRDGYGGERESHAYRDLPALDPGKWQRLVRRMRRRSDAGSSSGSGRSLREPPRECRRCCLPELDRSRFVHR